MVSFVNARRMMVDGQLRPNKITDIRLIDLFNKIPREDYVMEQDQQIAYIDETLPLIDGRFLLSPLAASRLLQLADIKSSDHVLEIGCATGYLSTIISYLCKSLVCVEQSETCAKFAAKKIDEAANDAKAVTVLTGPIVNGAKDFGPFDIIFINGKAEEIPDDLLEQLKVGGRIITIKNVNGASRAFSITRFDHGFANNDHFDLNAPELTEFKKQKGFEF